MDDGDALLLDRPPPHYVKQVPAPFMYLTEEQIEAEVRKNLTLAATLLAGETPTQRDWNEPPRPAIRPGPDPATERPDEQASAIATETESAAVAHVKASPAAAAQSATTEARASSVHVTEFSFS